MERLCELEFTVENLEDELYSLTHLDTKTKKKTTKKTTKKAK